MEDVRARGAGSRPLSVAPSPIVVGDGVVVATPSPAASQRTTTTAWWTLLALAGGHCAVDCCSGIWPVFKTLAHLDIATAGLIATIGSMTGNGLQLAFGVLADRGWRKRLIVTGVAVAGTVTLVPWAVRSYLIMGALVLVTNVGSAAFHPSATGAAANLSRQRVGFMIAVFLAGGYLGYALSQFLFSAVYESAHTLTPVIALLPLAMAAAIAIGLPAPAEARRAAWRRVADVARPPRLSRPALRRPDVRERGQHLPHLPAARPARLA